jgi:hypothetical protein
MKTKYSTILLHVLKHKQPSNYQLVNNNNNEPFQVQRDSTTQKDQE